MRSCTKSKARREYDYVTAYTERTGHTAGTLRNGVTAGIFPGSGNVSHLEERKHLVRQGVTGHFAPWLFSVVTPLRSCGTLQGSWELPLRNQLLLSTRVSLVETYYLEMSVVH